jgi:hypothetical protein
MIQLMMCSEAPLDAPNISHSRGLALEASFFVCLMFPFYPPSNQSQTTITLHIHQHIAMGHSFNRCVCIRIQSRIF